MEKSTGVAITGANGRMGRELLQASFENKNIEVAAALVRSGSQFIGVEATSLTTVAGESIQCTSQADVLNQSVDVLIDFTLPDNTMTNLESCKEAHKAMVIGTTGFSNEQQLMIEQAADKIAILQASNMSIGVNLTLALLSQTADVLADNPSLKIEISETHHIHKLDSPSGTAITMGEVITNSLTKKVVSTDDLINYLSIRDGEVVGDHTVSFITDDERIEITHKAVNRQIFAKGAIKAAQWLADKDPGLYSMNDVITGD